MNKHILLIEDEPGLILTLRKRLEAEGYDVTIARDGNTGLEYGLTGRFALVLLDVMLPGRDGFDVCRDLRRHDETTPILMLTARGQTIDKVLGLKLGADDYLTKPFQMAELLARMQALLRRSVRTPLQPSTSRYQFADVEVDLRRAEVKKAGTVLELSAKEYQLLCYFITHQGEARSRDIILNDVWGYDAAPTTRTVDVHVARLRQKIEPNPRHPQHILTIHNLGYRFDG